MNKKFEYTEQYVSFSNRLEDTLNAFGKEGWELVTILKRIGGDTAIFKREVVEEEKK